MSSRTDLKLDWCSHEAAKFSVFHWHYSKKMPAGKLVRIGVWENQKFIGCVLFGRGANRNIGKPFGLKQTEICELVRIALRKHQTPVTRIISIAVKMLRKHSPGIKMLVSYADPAQGHTGQVYRAANWIYMGRTKRKALRVDGSRMHKRTASDKWGTLTNIPWEWEYEEAGKHKFILPLDKRFARTIKANLR